MRKKKRGLETKSSCIMELLPLLALLSFILVVSCAPSEPAADENVSNVTEQPGEELERAGEEAGQEIETLIPGEMPPAGACTERWRCISSSMKVLQLANCSFGQRIECPLGCRNDTCRTATACISGFKCLDGKRRGFQTEACTYGNIVECSWKCENGACVERPANYTGENETGGAAEEPAAAPPPPRPTLRMGEVATVVVNEVEHNLSIYLLDREQVRIQLDRYRSDWIEDGGNKTFPNGVNVIITGIYFQSYAGGRQEIEYSAG